MVRLLSIVEESIAQKKQWVRRILSRLQRCYPTAGCTLQYSSAWQLLVAAILSAQSTDETVNRVTVELFERYPSPRESASARLSDLERIVRPAGFFRQKARYIRNSSRLLLKQHSGEVPDQMEELIQLPGVARKTANVVLGTWFKHNVGVAVDTHVGRLARRLGLSWTGKDAKDAVHIEQDLMEIVPRKEWTYISHALIQHGRLVCTARKPACGECFLKDCCPSVSSLELSRDETGQSSF